MAVVDPVPGTGAGAHVLAVAHDLLLILADAIVQVQLPASRRLHTEIAIWAYNLSRLFVEKKRKHSVLY